MQQNSSKCASRTRLHPCLRRAGSLAASFVIATFTALATTQAATITVTALDDDVFVNAAGATFSDVALTVASAPTKCTLRMAIAAANLDVVVGGCVAGNSESSSASPYAQPNGYPDAIVFTTGLAGTISLNTSAFMFAAPAVLVSGTTGLPVVNTQSILVVSRPLVVTGNVDAGGAPNITLDGGRLTNPAVNARPLAINDGIHNIDTPVEINNLTFQNARVASSPGGCMVSRETIRLSNVVFEGCYSEGSATQNGYGGALGVLALRQGANPLPHTRPDVWIRNSRFSNNKALRGAGAVTASAGGAMALGSSSTAYVGHVFLENVTVNNNSADSAGGLNLGNAQSVTIRGTTFHQNESIGTRDVAVAPPNAATALDSGYNGGANISNFESLLMDTVSFTQNTANQRTGGARVANGGPFTGRNLLVDANRAGTLAATGSTGVGGMDISSVRSVYLNSVQVTNNVLDAAPSIGGSIGGLRIRGATVEVVTDALNVFSNQSNNASVGGLDIRENNTVTMTRTNVFGNSTTSAGSAFAGHAALTVTRNRSFYFGDGIVQSNTSAQFGVANFEASFRDRDNAGAAVSPLPDPTNTLTISRSLFMSNTSPDAVVNFVNPGVFNVLNTTFTGNNGGANGGAIRGDAYNPHSAADAFKLRIRNSTMHRNTASVQSAVGIGAWTGAAQGAFNGSVIIESSILGKPTAGSSVDALWISDASKLTMSNSLVEDSAGPVSAQCASSGNICNTDPMLEAVTIHGGNTFTMRPKRGSPVIDAGSNVTNSVQDQRRADRVVGVAADMGAHETPVNDPIANCSLDMDGANGVQAFREGLVLVRSMLGFASAAAVANTGITEPQWNATKANLNANCGTNFP